MKKVHFNPQLSVSDNFIVNRFGTLDDDYSKGWQNRFNKGMDYALGCMDFDSLEVFQQTVESYIAYLKS